MRSAITLIILLCVVFQSFTQDRTILSVQTGHSGPVNELIFSPDDSYIATAGADNNVILWDLRSGKQMNIFTGHEDEVTGLSFHPNKNLLASGSLDGTVRVFNYPDGTIVKTLTFDHEVGSVSFSHDGSQLAIGSFEISLLELSGDRVSTLSITKGTERIDKVVFASDSKLLAFSGKKRKTVILDLSTKNIVHEFKFKSHDLAFDPSSTTIYGGTATGKYFKKSLVSRKKTTIKANRIWKNYFNVAISDEYLVASNKDGHISVFDIQKNRVSSLLKGHDGAVRALAISNNQQFMASAGVDKKIQIWNLEEGNLTQSLRGNGNRINDVAFDSDSEHIIIAYENGDIKKGHLTPDGNIQDQKTSKNTISRLLQLPINFSVDSISSIGNSKIVFSGSKKWADRSKDEYRWRKPLEISWNLSTGEVSTENSLKKELRAIDNARDRRNYLNKTYHLKPEFKPKAVDSVRRLSATIQGNNLVLIDLDSDQIVFTTATEHTDIISSISFNPKYDIVVTGSWDGTVKFWNFMGELLLTYSIVGEEDFIFIDPKNNYFATKGALEDIGFLYKGQILSFEQFDLKYNRPDLVFKRLPHINPEYIASYERAYEKRLNKLGINPESLEISDDIPTLSINTSEQVATKSKKLNIQLSANDKKGKLDRLYLEVNGVPEFGKEGIEIPGEKNNWVSEIEIELSEGLNEIQAYVLNQSGIASLRESIKITYESPSTTPDLYLVAIGASQYDQSDFNLTYAAKDARDIATAFTKSKIFNKVNTLVITDEEFTLEKIKQVKDFIGKAGVDDLVLISIAGHGVLDKNLDYYLATHDMDFSDPAERGLAYDELENLLSYTSSRKKTLLLDACHSGELDKEEVELAYEETTEFGEVTFRAVGTRVVSQKGMSLQSSFELSKSLFADMRSSNGSSVISSAGGAEYAMEGSEWNNGVFTFCLLEGLTDQTADLNGDNKIMLSELQEYIFDQVVKITNGKQRPTSRVENLKVDFRIW